MMLRVHRLVGGGAAILLVVGCRPTSRDICTVPISEPAQTKAQIKEAYGDQAERIGAWSNLENRLPQLPENGGLCDTEAIWANS